MHASYQPLINLSTSSKNADTTFGFFSILTNGISLDLREEELADDAVEAGLQGSFFRSRALSRPFSLGEGSGVPRGEVGSWWKDKN